MWNFWYVGWGCEKNWFIFVLIGIGWWLNGVIGIEIFGYCGISGLNGDVMLLVEMFMLYGKFGGILKLFGIIIVLIWFVMIICLELVWFWNCGEGIFCRL